MERALYGPRGFYRREQPGSHFRTSAHASPLFAEALLELAGRVAGQLPADRMAVVDVGAGAGELCNELAARAPSHWRLVAVDLRPRPASLHPRVEWQAECPDDIDGVLFANELLDNVPVDVVERAGQRWVQVLVDSTGTESRGAVCDAAARQWLAHWWPQPRPGDRAEVGLARDRLWADLGSRLRSGIAIVVDYALDPDRHQTGTLTAHRAGQRVDPLPDGSCDLTAHVQMSSVALAGEGVGLQTALSCGQRQALMALGVSARRPTHAGASADPARYLRALAAAGEAAELLDPDGLGGFQWLVQGRNVDAAALLPELTTGATG